MNLPILHSASIPTPAPKGPKKKSKARAGIKKEVKKEIRKEIKKEIKEEIKKKVVDKRLRSASSADVNKPAKRLPFRQGCAATQARAVE